MSDAANRRRTIGPWTALAAFVALLIAVTAMGPMLRAVLAPFFPVTTQQGIVAFRIATGLPFSWIALGGTIAILRLRGQGLADIGWRRPATIWAWLMVVVVVGYLIWSSFRHAGCQGWCFIDPQAWLTDWSTFRVASSVAIGITAGVCEEICFRGFVMTEARDGGAPAAVQVLLAGATFGVAHTALAGMSGRFDLAAAIGIVGSTTVFGLLFGVVYLLGRRSLTPLILAHGVFAFTTEPWTLLWGLAKTMQAAH